MMGQSEHAHNVISQQRTHDGVTVQVIITETVRPGDESCMDWIQTAALTAGFIGSVLDETDDGETVTTETPAESK